ncbi:MAG: pyruvate kinase [Patescibacteria group bacterium]
MRHSVAQILITIGPATCDKEVLSKLVDLGADAVRMNFSWGTHEEYVEYIKTIRAVAVEKGRQIPIIQDLSGPRKRDLVGHSFDKAEPNILTEKDLSDLDFGISQGVDYIAQSFVGNDKDVLRLKDEIAFRGGEMPVIAKIERREAVSGIKGIISATDAIMVARGDLGNEVPLEDIPLIEKDIIELCKKAGKPVIVATQMLFTMVENTTPTRAEVTDVEFAILSGADIVMLSDETTTGKHPLEAVEIMEKSVCAAEERLIRDGGFKINPLKTLN